MELKLVLKREREKKKKMIKSPKKNKWWLKEGKKKCMIDMRAIHTLAVWKLNAMSEYKVKATASENKRIIKLEREWKRAT